MNPAVSQSRATTAVAFEDGLGERLYAVGAANEPLEVLKISSELSCVASFEELVRAQAARLADFRHEAFGRVRAVERLDPRTSTIVVVSNHVRGVRLSELLAGTAKRSIALEFAAAACLIRQLVSAAAALHGSGPGVCHGAIAPERIVITGDGRVVLVEYVLAPALEEMHFSWERYWRELGIALPRPIGLPHFDQTADVTQVAAVALALLLGRPLTVNEYPHRIADVLESATARQANGDAPLPAALRSWLRHALHIEPRATFASAVAARAELDSALDVDDAAGRAALKSFLARYAAAVTLERHAGLAKSEPPVAPAKETGASVTPFPTPAPPANPAPPLGPRSVAPFVPRAVASEPPALDPEPAPRVSPDPEPRLDEKESVEVKPAGAPRALPGRPAWASRWLAGAVVVLIAVTAGFTLMRETAAAPGAAAAATGTLEIGTNPDRAPVFIDGSERGVTPLTVTLPAGAHVVELVNGAERRRVPVTLKAGAHVAHFIELSKPAAGAGALQVRTDPSRATVTVDGRAYGRTPVTVRDLAPGTHKVVLQNESGAFSEDVVIEAGATASLVVPMTTRPQGANVSGWITISAPVDLQVFEAGRLVGSSRSDRIMVAVGRHELELVNEALGYRSTRVVEVSAGQVTLVKPDWPKGTLAVNATPWAEVSIDGERAGETPIGGVTVPIGTHEVVFRHPELGERRTTVTVTAGAAARVSVDMRAK